MSSTLSMHPPQVANKEGEEQIRESEASNGPLKLEYLLGKNFTKKDIELLRGGGLHTVDSIWSRPVKEITCIKGISEQKALNLKEAAADLCGNTFISAADYLHAREKLTRFHTGSTQLDKLLEGGIETGGLTELIGEFRTGKTQLLHTISVTCQLPSDSGGASARCMWIDTEGTFRPERVGQIATRFSLNVEACLQNIAVIKANNCDHFIRIIQEAAALIMDGQFALLIIDSIAALYRSEFIGRGELAARQGHLCKALRLLQRLADEYGIAVVYSNQVIAKVDSMPGMFGGNDKIPACGHILAHASQTRLFLRKGRGDNRICKVYDSPCLPEGEAVFQITEGGVQDCDD